MKGFDVVVVGGGSSGCVVAGRLATEHPGARIALVEAGPPADAHPETLSASGYKTAFVNDALFWERYTTPQPNAGGQRIFAGTGHVLGGSGAVNGMVYTRGAREDYAEWPEGWRWDDVVPDFEALERRLRPRRRPPTRWTEACISAAVACGFERRDDLNDGRLSNAIGYEWMNYEGADRRSSYVAYVREPAPPNLTVYAEASVDRLVFDAQRRVESVALSTGESLRVDGEVVLCAGALETPKVLMLSGVGPEQALRAAGITPVLDAPAIGQNLHDHPNVPLFFACRKPVDCLQPQLYSFYRTRPGGPLPEGQSDTCYVFWPAPSAMKQALQRMLPGKLGLEGPGAARQALRAGVEGLFAVPGVNEGVQHLYGIVVILGKPHSRGSVRLKSRDPRVSAAVDPAYFSDPRDLETLVLGVRHARRLSRSAGLKGYGSVELQPAPLGVGVSDDAAIGRWVANNAITTFHFAGTCRMGHDANAPVDPHTLRVRGLANVRVADASVVPWTPVSAMNAPSMLVGHRAATAIGRTLA